MLLEWMAEELRLSKHYIQWVANTGSHHYREYSVTGRSGKPRLVYHPSRQLKALQRWLLRVVIAPLPIHDAATAYEEGRGTRLNAARHRCSRFLLRMDFTDFFPSLTDVDVRTALEKAELRGRLVPSWNLEDTELLVNLVCRNRSLVIGAPTSPKLANAICFELDEALRSLADTYDARYTRYADDLFFSATRPGVLKQVEAEVAQIVTNLGHPHTLN